MGNSYTKDPNLDINIQTQKAFYNSGNNIEGVIFVNAKSQFNFDALYVRVEGDQYCQWFEGSSKNRRKFTGSQNFYAVQHMICRLNDSILPTGKYAYPFSLELSQNIPGSFDSSQYDAKIQYKLIAYFAHFENKTRQHYEIPLLIRQPFRQEPCQYEGKVRKSPTTCWCFNQGQTQLKVRFGKNVSFEDQSVRIQIQANNENGKSPISDFVIELVRYTFVSANSGVYRTYRKVQKTIKAGRKVQKGQKVLPFDVDFVIPQVDQQTAISTLVANYYRLQVYADIASISFDEPSVYSPLFIMKEDFPQAQNKNLTPQINSQDYKIGTKKQIFRAPEYWFRKNKNLQVMNFRLQDGVGPQTQNDAIMM